MFRRRSGLGTLFIDVRFGYFSPVLKRRVVSPKQISGFEVAKSGMLGKQNLQILISEFVPFSIYSVQASVNFVDITNLI